MSIGIVGSIAYDTIETPFGKIEKTLGGSASYATLAASIFPSSIFPVAIVGDDFNEKDWEIFRRPNIQTEGIRSIPGKTFQWDGAYSYNLSEAITNRTELNVLATFDPIITDDQKKCSHLFLGNLSPRIQLRIIEQFEKKPLTVMDTMNYWIDSDRAGVEAVLAQSHILTINEQEARDLTKEYNLLKAGRALLRIGPRCVIIKRGEYGTLVYAEDHIFASCGFPLEDVFDPTGAGDTFAGGLIGYLAESGLQAEHLSDRLDDIRRAVICGSTLASFTVQDFGIRRLTEVTKEEFEKRLDQFKQITQYS